MTQRFGCLSKRDLPVFGVCGLPERARDLPDDRMLAQLLQRRRVGELLCEVIDRLAKIIERHWGVFATHRGIALPVERFSCGLALLRVGLCALGNRFARALAVGNGADAFGNTFQGARKVARLALGSLADRRAAGKRAQARLDDGGNARFAVGRRSAPDVEVASKLDIALRLRGGLLGGIANAGKGLGDRRGSLPHLRQRIASSASRDTPYDSSRNALTGGGAVEAVGGADNRPLFRELHPGGSGGGGASLDHRPARLENGLAGVERGAFEPGRNGETADKLPNKSSGAVVLLVAQLGAVVDVTPAVEVGGDPVRRVSGDRIDASVKSGVEGVHRKETRCPTKEAAGGVGRVAL